MTPHDEWLFKADHDLKSAQILFCAQDPVLDMAIYHTQQCAEKALKAFLVFREQALDRTHNLDVLNSQCLALDPSFESIQEAALFLRPFATVYRYPEGELEPSPSKVEKAIETAKTVLDFVNKTIQKTS